MVHQALTGTSGAIQLIAALRCVWLLPDWLAKWQSLAAYRRRVRRGEQTTAHRTGGGGGQH